MTLILPSRLQMTLICLCVLCFSHCANTASNNSEAVNEAEAVVPMGLVAEIQSASLNEGRTLNIYLPPTYHPDSSTTYPVIYLLDGSAHEDYLHIAGLVQFLNLYEILPPAILVGIANVDRYRDFSHPSKDPEDLEQLPTSGGSAAFMDFLANELQPYINNRFLTNGHRTIIGQSMGGLLATEVLFKRPHLFEDYLIVSPSLWWDQQSMINDADAYVAALGTTPKRIFLSLGDEHPVMHEVADKLAAALEAASHPDLTFIYEPLPEENHATVLHRAVYLGFERLYEKNKE